MKNIKAKTSAKEKTVKTIITIFVIVAVCTIAYFVLKFTGILDKIDSVEDLKEVIAGGGVWSYIIFVIIQFLQVTFIPIPAAITTIAGVLVFDPWTVLILSLIAVMLGSIFAFWLGKKFGRKIVVWIAGEEDAKKWNNALAQGKYLFFLMMLFPGFPDDILCIVAGATPMTYKFFIITNLITRPIIFTTIVFFGSGLVIPFSGWGIPVWIALIIVIAVLFYLSVKYKNNIENCLINLNKKIKNATAKQRNKKKSLSKNEVDNKNKKTKSDQLTPVTVKRTNKNNKKPVKTDEKTDKTDEML